MISGYWLIIRAAAITLCHYSVLSFGGMGGVQIAADFLLDKLDLGRNVFFEVEGI